MTQTIDEPTGLSCWKLEISREDEMVRVSIHGPKDGEKAFVMILTKDLRAAVNRECSSARRIV